MKYKVGDKVRLRRDLEVGKEYSGLTLLNEMYENHDIMTIKRSYYYYIENGVMHYRCEENPYFWGEDMLEKVENIDDNEQVRTVDVGFHLDCCGHKVLKNVVLNTMTSYGHIFFNIKDDKNQYILLKSAIDFIIPHED